MAKILFVFSLLLDHLVWAHVTKIVLYYVMYEACQAGERVSLNCLCLCHGVQNKTNSAETNTNPMTFFLCSNKAWSVVLYAKSIPEALPVRKSMLFRISFMSVMKLPETHTNHNLCFFAWVRYGSMALP